ncbi:hypothetical protein SLS62_006849 [Diatrype stigma]|uniref:Uncharacterized protein n=1 Tax=Diatrype stigma TaxID=117547 RepID=A0AAN9URU7_9PEZI
MPLEILLQIVGHMDPATRIGLAQASPIHFVNANFNIFVQDAQFQVQLQDTPPHTETDDTRPLLLWAIENNVGLPVLDQIITAYQHVNPGQWADSIWGPLARELPTPLWAAIRVARPDVVDLLLQRGANYGTRYCLMLRGRCNRQGYPHHQCLHPPAHPAPLEQCSDALEYAVRAVSTYLDHRDQRQAIVRRLVQAGARFELLDAGDNISALFRRATWHGLHDVLILMMDEILNLPSGDTRRARLAGALDEMLRRVACDLPRDGDHNMLLEYLVNRWAPTTYHIQQLYDNCQAEGRLHSMAAIRRARRALGLQR